MLPSPAFFADVCAAFGLGTPISNPLAVSGGLSNRLYRLRTVQGEFAIKRMVANAGATTFKANVEASHHVELLALAAGIALPPPIPALRTDEALARISDGAEHCWVRVHEWVSATPLHLPDLGPGDIVAVAGLLARLHCIPAPEVAEPFPPLPSRDWTSALPHAFASPDLLTGIGIMEEIVREGYASASHARVMSHRDLDAKNVLRSTNGGLVLVDWDAAGPVVAEWDMAATALEWAHVRDVNVSAVDFDRFLNAYHAAGGHSAPITTGSFAGWCEGVLDWLWFNLERAADSDHIERQLGLSEVAHSARFIPTAARWIAAYP